MTEQTLQPPGDSKGQSHTNFLERMEEVALRSIAAAEQEVQSLWSEIRVLQTKVTAQGTLLFECLAELKKLQDKQQ